MQDPAIVEALSRDRLDGYVVKGGPNTDRDLLGRYLYNLAVSQALYPFFHTLEVVLRNRVYSVVANDRPIDVDRRDLYHDFPCWLDEKASILTVDHQREVHDAKRAVISDIRKRHGPTAANGSRFRTSGRLVAKLPLSFWVFLFDEDYVGPGRNLGILWPRYFEAVFRHRNGAGSITIVRKLMRRLLVLRNRIMHFERIAPWLDHHNTALDPRRVRDDIIELLSWLEPRTVQALGDYGPLDEVFDQVYERYFQWASRRI